MRFEWDEKKSRLNHNKHGISFNIAVEVFCGPILLNDSRSDSEGRGAVLDHWAAGKPGDFDGRPYDPGRQRR